MSRKRSYTESEILEPLANAVDEEFQPIHTNQPDIFRPSSTELSDFFHPKLQSIFSAAQGPEQPERSAEELNAQRWSKVLKLFEDSRSKSVIYFEDLQTLCDTYDTEKSLELATLWLQLGANHNFNQDYFNILYSRIPTDEDEYPLHNARFANLAIAWLTKMGNNFTSNDLIKILDDIKDLNQQGQLLKTWVKKQYVEIDEIKAITEAIYLVEEGRAGPEVSEMITDLLDEYIRTVINVEYLRHEAEAFERIFAKIYDSEIYPANDLDNHLEILARKFRISGELYKAFKAEFMKHSVRALEESSDEEHSSSSSLHTIVIPHTYLQPVQADDIDAIFTMDISDAQKAQAFKDLLSFPQNQVSFAILQDVCSRLPQVEVPAIAALWLTLDDANNFDKNFFFATCAQCEKLTDAQGEREENETYYNLVSSWLAKGPENNLNIDEIIAILREIVEFGNLAHITDQWLEKPGNSFTIEQIKNIFIDFCGPFHDQDRITFHSTKEIDGIIAKTIHKSLHVSDANSLEPAELHARLQPFFLEIARQEIYPRNELRENFSNLLHDIGLTPNKSEDFLTNFSSILAVRSAAAALQPQPNLEDDHPSRHPYSPSNVSLKQKDFTTHNHS